MEVLRGEKRWVSLSNLDVSDVEEDLPMYRKRKEWDGTGDGKRGESQHIREDATSRQAGSHEGCRKKYA